MKKKITALFLCLTMLVSVCVPGTFTTGIDAQATESEFQMDVNEPSEAIVPDEADSTAETADASETAATEEKETSDETDVSDETAVSDKNALSDETVVSDKTAVSDETAVSSEISEDAKLPSEEPEQSDESLTKEPVSFSELSEEDQEIIMAMIYRKEGLDGVMMLDDPASQADEMIDGNWFVITKASTPSGSPAQTIPAGEITAEKVPNLTGEGYTFAGAFYNGIPVLRVGQVEYSGKTYVYYVTEGSETDLVALVLDDGDQIELRYKKNPVAINYTVRGGTSTATNTDGSITVNGIPYGQTATGTVTVIPADNPDEVFPGDDYSFTVEIPRGYHATVTVNGTKVDPELGVMPTYQMQLDRNGNRDGNGTIIQTDNSVEYLPRYTYTVEKAGENDQKIDVILTKETTHSFSADLISYTAYFGGTYEKNRKIHGDRASSNPPSWTGNIAANGTYTWTLTTTTVGASWEMDALQMNGTDLKIPFVNGKVETTTLPSGTEVSISRAYAQTSSWPWGDDTNRFVYTIQLSGCYENVVVTGGNLRARNHNEYIPYEFTGVESFQYRNKNNSWVNGYISQPIAADDVNSYHSFRFKVLPGYGNPKLILKRSNEQQTTQQTPKLSIDSNGYYTASFDTYNLQYPVLIVIEAEIITFDVTYHPGTVSNAENIPVDQNKYSLAGTKEVLIPLEVPKDPTGYRVFTGWKNGNKTYVPNTLVSLEELQADRNNNKITFTAQWENVTNAEQITYTIQFVNSDNDNVLKTTTSQAPANTALILDVNSPTIADWLKQNPEYEVDTGRTQFYYPTIQNGSEVTLYVKEKEATITYVAVGPDDATGFGSVNPGSETIKVKTGTANGSDAAAGTNYRFMGWFDNAACEGEPISKDPHYTPSQSGDLWEDATYYALFDYALADLKIKKSGCEMIDENQSFVFHVKGMDDNIKEIDMTVVVHGNSSVTIKDLPVGNYMVTEENGWSWRYTNISNRVGNSWSGSLTAGQVTEVPFQNYRNKNLKWLNGCAYCDNRWINDSADQSGTNKNEGRRP